MSTIKLYSKLDLTGKDQKSFPETNNNTLKKSKKKSNKYLVKNKNTWIQKPMWCSKSTFSKKVYSNTILPQETIKIWNKELKLTPKATRERKTDTTQN